MTLPPPATTIPPDQMTEYWRLLGLYYEACRNGNTAYAQQLVQQMRGLLQTTGPGFAENMRQFFISLQPVIRPALVAAGAAWATITSVTAEVAAFTATIASGIGAALVAAWPVLLIVLVLVLLYWWMWHQQREEWRRAGYPQAMQMHSPEDGFPANSRVAAEFRAVCRQPQAGCLEVIEGRAAYG